MLRVVGGVPEVTACREIALQYASHLTWLGAIALGSAEHAGTKRQLRDLEAGPLAGDPVTHTELLSVGRQSDFRQRRSVARLNSGLSISRRSIGTRSGDS
jgi:hypothetical protein